MKPLAVALFILSLLPAGVRAEPVEAILDGSVRPAHGGWTYKRKLFRIAGIEYREYGMPEGASLRGGRVEFTVTLPVAGSDRFRALVGMRDDVRVPKGSVAIVLDGKLAWQSDLQRGRPAIPVDVELTGAREMQVTTTLGVVFARPRLWKGSPPPEAPAAEPVPARPQASAATPDVDAPASGEAVAFGVHPVDLDHLAAAFRRSVDDNRDLRDRLARGTVAVSSFSTPGGAAPAVAQAVAEDLHTAFVQQHFRVVERGRLDRALREAKVTDAAGIDAAAAREIGKRAGCGFLLVGSITDRGPSLVVNARLLESATGEAVAAHRVEIMK